jgi:hypothetical protein
MNFEPTSDAKDLKFLQVFVPIKSSIDGGTKFYLNFDREFNVKRRSTEQEFRLWHAEETVVFDLLEIAVELPHDDYTNKDNYEFYSRACDGATTSKYAYLNLRCRCIIDYIPPCTISTISKEIPHSCNGLSI